MAIKLESLDCDDTFILHTDSGEHTIGNYRNQEAFNIAVLDNEVKNGSK